jgi:hypothetical protein
MSTEDIEIVIEVINGTLNSNNETRNISIKKIEELRSNTPALVYCLIKILEGNNEF